MLSELFLAGEVARKIDPVLKGAKLTKAVLEQREDGLYLVFSFSENQRVRVYAGRVNPNHVYCVGDSEWHIRQHMEHAANQLKRELAEEEAERAKKQKKVKVG